MEKKAFKFNKPGFDKLFRYAKSKDLLRAYKRQKRVRKYYSNVPKERLREVIRRSAEKLDRGDKILGTVYDTPKGKRVLLNRILREGPPIDKRSTLAHEAFHAKTPLLGRSEILAHFYGGVKGKKGSLGEKVRYGLGEIRKLLRGRPNVFKDELLNAAIGAGVVGYGGKKLIDKATGKKKNSAEEKSKK